MEGWNVEGQKILLHFYTTLFLVLMFEKKKKYILIGYTENVCDET